MSTRTDGRADGSDWFATPLSPADAGDTAVVPDRAPDPVPGQDRGSDPSPDPSPDQVTGPGPDGDPDLFDDWTPPRRTNRLTAVLAALLVAVVAFAGGAFAHQRWGGTSAAAGAAGIPAISGAGFPAGAAGGFPGGRQAAAEGADGSAAGGAAAGSAPDGAAAGSAAGGAAAGSAAGGAAAGSAPVVVGTVTAVGDGTLTVKNFAGDSVTVTVPDDATVTAPGLDGVTTGMTVAVVGEKTADTAVTASSITARAAR